MAEARAFWTARPGHGEIRTESVPEPGPHEVVVRARFSGISRGTEALVFQGLVPSSQYDRMRAPFQAGTFPAPVKYGYASVGTVEQGPPDLKGRSVFVLHPHQTRYVVPADALHVLPPGVPEERAVLAANLETALNGVWDGRPQVGDRVTVVGGGTVGCLVAWLTSRIPGVEVELVDRNHDRSVTAGALGVRFSTPDTVSLEADLVFHASGTADGLGVALRVAGFEATIVELSWYGSQSVTAPLGELFHSQRLILKSSQVGSIATSQRARWDARRRMRLTLSLLHDSTLDALISGESDFDALPDVMAALASSPGGALCHRVRYP